jgi:hypothetical protein
MALERAVAGSVAVALSLALSYPFSLTAESPKPLQPVKSNPGASNDPMISAQIQIARLRQTADKLRVLASQTVPVNLQGESREEFFKHEQWLRQAGHRVNVLAGEWEQKIKPTGAANASARAIDVNSFFIAQSAALQSKLQRESFALTIDIRSEPVRYATDTARLVIEKMN